MSLRHDDVCARMVIRIPQLAKDMSPGGCWSSPQYDPLDLKIRARMCANHTYDCMWHWLTARRQEAQAKDVVMSPVAVQPQDGVVVQNQVDLGQGISGLEATAPVIGDGFDLFNSMDWLLGDLNYMGYDFSAGAL